MYLLIFANDIIIIAGKEASMKYLVQLKDITRYDIQIAGRKAANLGELLSFEQPVEEGLVLTSSAFDLFIHTHGINPASHDAYKRILTTDIPSSIMRELQAYGFSRPVTIRSSATIDDIGETNGFNAFDNVIGLENAIECIKKCYASLYSTTDRIYRKSRGYDDSLASMAIIIQETSLCEIEGTVTSNDASIRVLPASLDNEAKERLSVIARTVEEHYGFPICLDYVISQGNIYLRQVSRLPQQKKYTPEDFKNLAKPKPLRGKFRGSFIYSLERVNHPYYPLDHDYGHLTGTMKRSIIHEAGVAVNELVPMDAMGISTFIPVSLGVTLDLLHLPDQIKEVRDIGFNVYQCDDTLTKFKAILVAENAMENISLSAVGSSLDRMHTLIKDIAYASLRYAFYPHLYENATLSILFNKTKIGKSSNDILEGLHYVSADVSRDMYKILQKMNNEEKEAFMHMSYNAFMDAFPRMQKSMNAFMDMYGEKSDFSSYCFKATSWKEDPDRLMKVMRVMLESNTVVVPFVTSTTRYNAYLNAYKTQLDEDDYAHFLRKAEAVRTFHAYMEAYQYLLEACFHHCRELLRKAAASLDTDYEDLLYLFKDELLGACARGYLHATDIQSIGIRKAKRPLAEAYWNHSIDIMLDCDDRHVKGTIGNRGITTGATSKILSTNDFHKMKKGNILVCHYTDSEWEPVMSMASAIVVDTGSIFSHASMIAKKLDIPCIVATGNATRTLNDNAKVTVNANTGKVIPQSIDSSR